MTQAFFTRTLTSTEIAVGTLEIGSTNIEVLDTLVEPKKVSPEKALRIAQKHYKDLGTQVVVLDVKYVNEKRGLSEEDFMKYSVIIEDEVADDEESSEPAEETHSEAL